MSKIASFFRELLKKLGTLICILLIAFVFQIGYAIINDFFFPDPEPTYITAHPMVSPHKFDYYPPSHNYDNIEKVTPYEGLNASALGYLTPIPIDD